MDIVGRNNGRHCHVVPPFVILGDIALILLEGMIRVKKSAVWSSRSQPGIPLFYCELYISSAMVPTVSPYVTVMVQQPGVGKLKPVPHSLPGRSQVELS
jgi:hypothetical protein